MPGSLPLLFVPGSLLSTHAQRALADVARQIPGVQVLEPTRMDELPALGLSASGRLVIVSAAASLLPALNRLPRSGRDLEVWLVDPDLAPVTAAGRIHAAARRDGTRHELPCLRVESSQLSRPSRAFAVRAGRAAELARALQDAAAHSTAVGRAMSRVRGVVGQLDLSASPQRASITSLRIDGAAVTPPLLLEAFAAPDGVHVRALERPARLDPATLRELVASLRPRVATELLLAPTGAFVLDRDPISCAGAHDWRVTVDEPLVVWR